MNVALSFQLSPTTTLSVAAYISILQVKAIIASEALRSSEFIVGVMMGLYGLKVLLPPSISLVMGMTSGFSNARLLFPGEAGE